MALSCGTEETVGWCGHPHALHGQCDAGGPTTSVRTLMARVQLFSPASNIACDRHAALHSTGASPLFAQQPRPCAVQAISGHCHVPVLTQCTKGTLAPPVASVSQRLGRTAVANMAYAVCHDQKDPFGLNADGGHCTAPTSLLRV